MALRALTVAQGVLAFVSLLMIAVTGYSAPALASATLTIVLAGIGVLLSRNRAR